MTARTHRRRLGAELRRLRTLSGLSGRALADRVGLSQSSISRAENGHQVLSLPEVDRWADAVGATEEQRETLHALTEAALNEIETWRERQRTEGLRGMQAHVGQLEATARSLVNFQPTLVPGLLQTAAYALRVFALVDVLGNDDHPAAVQARLERQKILYDTRRSFEFIMLDEVLRRPVVPADVLAAQLDHIASVATLPNVTVRVIPVCAPVRALPWCGFNLHADLADGEPPYVMVELPHAGVTVSDPEDVAIYQRHLTLLRESSLPVQESLARIHAVAAEMRTHRQ